MKNKGFTLLEIEIALFLLLVCSLSIMSLYTIAVNSTKKARSLTIATFLAQEKMEEVLEAASYPPLFRLEGLAREGNFSPPFSQYQFSFTINDHERLSILKRVKVTVEGPNNVRVFLASLKRALKNEWLRFRLFVGVIFFVVSPFVLPPLNP